MVRAVRLRTATLFALSLLSGISFASLVGGAGCGSKAPPPAPVSAAMLEPPPPAAGDPSAEGAPYLAMVAGRLAPEWRHFLDDCRLRLSSEHPLNSLQLEARATLVFDRTGKLVSRQLAGSGNADFDTAVNEVLAAISPLPPPPAWLLSDDDQLRLSWLFARDARQASAAHAQVSWLEEPAPQVVERRLAAGDIAGAARRLSRLTDEDPVLREQARKVFLAAVEEALAGSGQVQRAAVEAVRRAQLKQLASKLMPLARDPDPALRAQAATALAAVGDSAAAPLLLEQLAATRDRQLAATLVRALVTMGPAGSPDAVVIKLADGDREAQLTALAALAEMTVSPALAQRVSKWAISRDPAVRGALCAAVARAKILASLRWEILGKGLDDRDGSTRAACTAALVPLQQKPQPWMRMALSQLVDDRDQRVRAAAVAASMRWAPTRLDGQLPRLVADLDPAVRASAVAALARRGDVAALRGLLADGDAGVRRTAALALALVDGPAVRDAALRDPDAKVRMVALEVRGDQSLALKLLANDESPEVRTEVEVINVANHGETLQSGMVRLSGADAATLDRVRIAMAWLLATS
jgi:HEAT repeat protein